MLESLASELTSSLKWSNPQIGSIGSRKLQKFFGLPKQTLNCQVGPNRIVAIFSSQPNRWTVTTFILNPNGGYLDLDRVVTKIRVGEHLTFFVLCEMLESLQNNAESLSEAGLGNSVDYLRMRSHEEQIIAELGKIERKGRGDER